MPKIEINEETRYCWECPSCGDYNEECEDLSDDEDSDYHCCGCSKTFNSEGEEK